MQNTLQKPQPTITRKSKKEEKKKTPEYKMYQLRKKLLMNSASPFALLQVFSLLMSITALGTKNASAQNQETINNGAHININATKKPGKLPTRNIKETPISSARVNISSRKFLNDRYISGKEPNQKQNELDLTKFERTNIGAIVGDNIEVDNTGLIEGILWRNNKQYLSQAIWFTHGKNKLIVNSFRPIYKDGTLQICPSIVGKVFGDGNDTLVLDKNNLPMKKNTYQENAFKENNYCKVFDNSMPTVSSKQFIDFEVVEVAQNATWFFDDSIAREETIIHEGGAAYFEPTLKDFGKKLTLNKGEIVFYTREETLPHRHTISNDIHINSSGTINVYKTKDVLTLDRPITYSPGSTLEKTGKGELVLRSGYYGADSLVKEGTLTFQGWMTPKTNINLLKNTKLSFQLHNTQHFGSIIQGEGNVSFNNSDDFFIRNKQEYTGTTDIKSGVVIAHSSLEKSRKISVEGGTLTGGGKLGATEIMKKGIHAPGFFSLAATTGLSVINLTQETSNYKNSGTLQLILNPDPEQSTYLTVGKDTTIADANLQFILGAPKESWLPHKTYKYTIIKNLSKKPIVGMFANKNFFSQDEGKVNVSYFFDADLEYGNDNHQDVYLMLKRNKKTFKGIDTTDFNEEQKSVYANINQMPENAAMKQYIFLVKNIEELKKTLNVLSGKIYPSIVSYLAQGYKFIEDSITKNLNDNTKQADTSSSVWFEAFNQSGALSDHSYALNHDSKEILLGANMHLKDWKIGALGGYGHTNLALDPVHSSASIKNYHIGAYAGTIAEPITVKIGSFITKHDIRSTRRGLYMSTPSAEYDAMRFNLFHETSYPIVWKKIKFDPFIKISHVSTISNTYEEKNSESALLGKVDDLGVNFLTLGLRTEKELEFNTIKSVIHGMIGFEHGFGLTKPETNHHFQSFAENFKIAGIPMATNHALIAIGLDIKTKSRISFHAAYEARLNEKNQNHNASLYLKVDF